MTTMGKRLVIVLWTAVAAMTVGCAGAPTEAVDSAGAAMTAAELGEAEAYAPDAYRAALEAQEQLSAEVNAQNDKFGLFRSYARTTELATAAQVAAEEAQTAAATERERLRGETSQLIADARQAVVDAQAELATAPIGKGSEADLAAMKADLAAVEASLNEADAAHAANRFLEAKTKAEAAMQTAIQVRQSVEQARALRGGARRPA